MSPAPPAPHPASLEEHAPLLNSHNSEEEGMVRSDSLSHTPSALEVVGRNSASGLGAVATQLGLVVSTAALWRVLYTHPAGLFTYHPSFQSLAVLGFLEGPSPLLPSILAPLTLARTERAGILLLQPQPPNAAYKRKGLQLHQVVQYTSGVAIVAGAAFIVYNKVAHGAKHFTTWHAKSGLLTLILIALQLTFGAVMVYTPLQRLIFKSEERAKKVWKYHRFRLLSSPLPSSALTSDEWRRMSGYLTLFFLILTPLLALVSDWVTQNSSKAERWVIGVGLGVAGLGAFGRVQTSKLGLKTR
ncbi:hypothetical protein OF846_001022 [Rhodotorula toruloides]|nr:hypothetical protein OF846_001022 [Rhodotorula toruloides]